MQKDDEAMVMIMMMVVAPPVRLVGMGAHTALTRYFDIRLQSIIVTNVGQCRYPWGKGITDRIGRNWIFTPFAFSLFRLFSLRL